MVLLTVGPKKIPPPPRITVSRLPGRRYAKPSRGPKLFQSVAKARTGVPLMPAKVTTPGVPDTGLIAAGSNEFILFPTTQRGNSTSQRRPALRVRRSVTRQSSCAYKARYEARDGILSETWMLAALTSPSRKLAAAFPVVAEDPGRSVIRGLMVKLPAEPRSRISSLAPRRYSTPNRSAWRPRFHESPSRNCWSVIGVWKRYTMVGLPNAAPVFGIVTLPATYPAGTP